MSLAITVVTTDGRRVVLDVDPSETVENVMILLEVELGVPLHHQRIVVGGSSKPLDPAGSLVAQGITASTTLTLLEGPSTATTTSNLAQQGPAPTATPPRVSLPPQALAPLSIEEQVAALMSGGRVEGGGRTPPPGVAAGAVPAPPIASLEDQVARLFRSGSSGGAAMLPHGQRQTPPVPLDPLDPEYQARLLENIRQQNLQQNLEQAIEHTPEAFGRVVMLYVPSVVNKIPVSAFVDSGAQMTIMNEQTAERCGLLRLLDRRYSGIAKGVGTSRILGRIHMALVSLGSIVIPMSITVLEDQSMEFLIGLDQLRRHRMKIDLEQNALVVEGVAIPFLGEGDLPLHLRDAAGNEEGEDEADNDSAGQKEKKNRNTNQTSKGAAGVASTTAPPPPTAASGPVTSSTPVLAPHAQGQVLTPAQEAIVARVVEMSRATRAVVIEMLEAAAWNEEVAIGLLFE